MHVYTRDSLAELLFQSRISIFENYFFFSLAFVNVSSDGSHQSGSQNQIAFIWVVVLSVLFDKTKTK